MHKHKDSRGVIEDLVVGKNSAVTRITFRKGAVRGNHYHKKTIQTDLVVSGKLKVYSDWGTATLKAGDIIEHPKRSPHAYKALEKSVLVTLCSGPRKGSSYESDTYRLKEEDKLV